MMNAKKRVALSGLFMFWLCAAVVFHYAAKNSTRSASGIQMEEIDVIAPTPAPWTASRFRRTGRSWRTLAQALAQATPSMERQLRFAK